jgi:hypothetical protein
LVNDFDPGPSRAISLQSNQYKPVVPSNSDWRADPIEYFHLFFDMDLFQPHSAESHAEC